MDQEKIGRFIAKLRKQKNMTQQELADKLGVTDRAVGNWENGRRLPDYSLLKDLCSALNITVNELLSGEEINKDIYMEKSEENLINLRRQIDKRKKIFKIISNVIFVIIAFLFFLNMVLNYMLPDDSHWTTIRTIGLYCSISNFVIVVIIELLSFKE